ncbi:MAG TPA: triphosphoribosyl-dephospho-CoA synthase [Gemmatimonadaceae bacterium]|nr:triphosphoribosyl-dephospho-CoA synthase [Gemmatimonadaceae bacterium]
MTRDQIVSAAQLACLLEASAPKPGNVSPGRDFHDTTYADFLAAAAAIGPALALAPDQSLGETILAAIAATRAWTPANVNLGIVLLLAPLARAALEPPRHAPLRDRAARVLGATTIADAERTYEAIRLAQPAGLGHAAEQDVATAPTLTLRDAMSLAAERDGIAREYATEFRTTFEHGAPAVARARADGLSWNDSVVETFLTLLAAAPDTHIARKLGLNEAQEVSHRAARVLAAGGVRTGAGRAAIVQLDGYLRDSRNARNPGTTADLCAAAIFVALLGGAW